MVTEAKRLIEAIVRKRTPVRAVAFRKTEEDTLRSQKTMPYVALLTADGKFDERTMKRVKTRSADGTLSVVQVRGTRMVPIEIRVAARSEEEADRYLGDVLRYLPHSWSVGDYAGRVDVLTEHHDDYASNAADRAIASAFVMFELEIGTDPEAVPQIGGSEVGPASEGE